MAIKTEKSSPQSDREQSKEKGKEPAIWGGRRARLELVPDPDRASGRDAEPGNQEQRGERADRERQGERVERERQDGEPELDAEQGRE